MFSKKLKRLRISHGWDQQQLAEKIGVGRSQISSYEIGRSKPRYEILVKLSELFNVPLDFFSEQSESPGDKLMNHVEFSDEDFLKRIKLFYQGDPLTDDEVKQLLNYLRFLKSKDNK